MVNCMNMMFRLESKEAAGEPKPAFARGIHMCISVKQQRKCIADFCNKSHLKDDLWCNKM